MPGVTLNEIVGARIRDLMALRGLTWAQLHEREGLSTNAIIRLRNGENVTLRTLQRVVAALECEVAITITPRGQA